MALAQRAGELWDQAREASGHAIIAPHGNALYGAAWRTRSFARLQESASSNRLQVETLSPAEVYRRYPAFEIPEDHAGLFDVQAGWIDVDASIASSHAYARSLGVECFFDQPVKAWDATETRFACIWRMTPSPRAAWSLPRAPGRSELLRDLQLPLAVKRKVVAWFDPSDAGAFRGGSRTRLLLSGEFHLWVPQHARPGRQMAEHPGGSFLPDADIAIQPPGPADLNPIAAIAAKNMPRLAGNYSEARARLRRSATCLYTMTPDDDFIVDHHPEFKNVVFAAGFSGHGFKFAPLIAVALADLVLAGENVITHRFPFAWPFVAPGGAQPTTISNRGGDESFAPSGDDSAACSPARTTSWSFRVK